MDKARKLRKRLERGDVLRVMGAHDGMGAKLIEKNGFDGVWAGGLELSTSHALPDASILTMTEFLNAAQIMNHATSLPLIADCDTGYGNALNVVHLVRRYETAGIAAVCIEDNTFPKINSFVAKKHSLSPINEFVNKIRAAKHAQQTKEFMVFARVEALIAGLGMKEALKRAKKYAEAGADGVFIHSKIKSPHEILEFIARWDLKTPLIICPTSYSSLTFDEIRKTRKVRVIIYANHGIRAQIRAMNNIFSSILKHGTSFPLEENISTLEEVFEIQGMDKLTELERLAEKPERERLNSEDEIPAKKQGRGKRKNGK